MINDLQEFRLNIPQNNQKVASGFFTKNKKVVLLCLATNIPLQSKEKIASMSLTPQIVSSTVGQEFKLDINVDTNNRKINGIDVVLLYDPQMLTAINSNTGTLFTTLLVNDIDPVAGKIVITASRISTAEEPVLGIGVLATTTFVPKKGGVSEVTILADPNSTNTSNVTETKTSKNILTHTSNAQITISQ